MTNNSKKREECTVMIGSVTQAMHAQKILERACIACVTDPIITVHSSRFFELFVITHPLPSMSIYAAV